MIKDLPITEGLPTGTSIVAVVDMRKYQYARKPARTETAGTAVFDKHRKCAILFVWRALDGFKFLLDYGVLVMRIEVQINGLWEEAGSLYTRADGKELSEILETIDRRLTVDFSCKEKVAEITKVRFIPDKGRPDADYLAIIVARGSDGSLTGPEGEVLPPKLVRALKNPTHRVKLRMPDGEWVDWGVGGFAGSIQSVKFDPKRAAHQMALEIARSYFKPDELPPKNYAEACETNN
jgi:hypothetical protein